DITHEQYLNGMRLETRRVVIPLPKREWGENYLHVYFLAKDNIYLWWGSGFAHPNIVSIYKNKKQINSQELQ
ncbi:hypothetical protein DOX53_22790, partial [Cronobacter malonaticus]|nr:hypothetical protein [Cronobacter malonaticus]EGT4315523.1 hypothetical protein [Cronobacter malonaticus]EGT4336842.1 hypothetical protein [Cronobacter malonaticus]EGT4402429.1 hypothetical protein [Cronobacter malonaticus]EGT4419323.1 hypothetical protein [Cronobacter malonaticus]